jgi:hypothetical protein
MAASQVTETERTQEVLRRELAAEREQLVDAVEQLRQLTNLSAQLRPRLPLLLLGAFAIGFVLSGGIGASARLMFRRGREGRKRARVGRFTLVERR